MTRTSLRAAALVGLVLSAACGDAPTEPAALLVAEHARAALDVSVPLPALAGAESMSAPEFAGVLADLGVWLDVAEARLERELPARPALASLRGEVASGRSLLASAARLEHEGERDAAVAALVGARAHLLRTTVSAVAERRIAAASAAAARCEQAGAGDGSGDPLDGAGRPEAVSIVRGDRLLAHAREALAEGDFERALQRAHYAEALLAGACRDGGMR